MANIIHPAAHLSRQKLNLYCELSDRLDAIDHLSKEDKYMKKIKTGKAGECFRHVGEIRHRERDALKTLENYLKTDTQKNPSHNHNKDLKKISHALYHRK
jgi:hypothetical protein